MKIEIEKKFLIDRDEFFKNSINLSNIFLTKIFFLKNIFIFLIKIYSLFNKKSLIVFKKDIVQFYIINEIDKVLRFRKENNKFFLNIKINKSLNNENIKSIEIEHKLNKNFSNELINFLFKSKYKSIEKIRFIVIYKGNLFEVDIFKKLNDGLNLLEIENKNFNKFKLPSWVKKEVTGDIRFFNSYLIEKPYSLWSNN